MAEIKLGILGRDLPERVGQRPELQQQVDAWEQWASGLCLVVYLRLYRGECRHR